VHPDNFANSTPHEKRVAIEYAATVNDAYRTLNSPLLRAIYLLKLHGIDIQSETDTNMPMEFLMEQMELRERLADGELLEIKNEVLHALMECEKHMSALLDNTTDQLLKMARELARKMQFYVRLSEEIAEKEHKS
jgi:molecular chaperone HscB